MFRVVIPARFGSVRLPGKVLIEVAGRSILEWAHRAARASSAQEVVIATDEPRVMAAAQAFGADAVLTAANHTSGTDRVAEVARVRRWDVDEIVVNLQGDEPLMPPALIDQVAQLLDGDRVADLATLCAPLGAPAELTDPNVVKVVCDRVGYALYFSRAPIPWERDRPGGVSEKPRALREARRHVGLYAYRVRALQLMTELPPSSLERVEKLEQLRALENGLTIRVGVARERPGQDVNTREDLERVAPQLEAARSRL